MRADSRTVEHVLLEHARDRRRDPVRDDPRPLGLSPPASDLATGEDDPPDRERLGVHAASRQRRVDGGHVERGHRAGAESERRRRLQLRLHAELLRHCRDRIRADVEREPGVDRVVRVERRRRDGLGPGVGAVVRADPPLERGIVEQRGEVARRPRVHPLRHRGREDDRLERRARLALGRGREVELVARRCRRHGSHRADRAGRGVDGDDRTRGVVPGMQLLRQGVHGGVLQARPDRRVDLQPARANGRRAVRLLQDVLDVADEIRLPARIRRARTQVETPVGRRRGVLRVGDVPAPSQRAQDRVAAAERGAGVVERVVVGRRLRQPGQKGSLLERQPARRNREVRLGRSLDPVGVVAVVDVVEVGGEDPVLRPGTRELDGEAGLDDLPLQRLVAREIEVAHELLRDGGAALDDAAGADVGDERPEDPHRVYAAVLVEPPILDRDGRLRHPRADRARRDGRPVLDGGQDADQAAVHTVNERVVGLAHGP